jgi:hypothetical protein
VERPMFQIPSTYADVLWPSATTLEYQATLEGGRHWNLVFQSPAHATGKKPEPSRTESEKTEPLYAVVSGLQPVAVTVL